MRRATARFLAVSGSANLADGLMVTAMPLLAVAAGAGPLGVTAVAVAAEVPWLLAPSVGAAVDRFPGRAALLTSTAGRLAGAGTVALAVGLGLAPVPVLVVIALLFGVLAVLGDTTAEVVVTRLVDESSYELVGSRLVALEMGGNHLVGPVIGAALFGTAAVLPPALAVAAAAVACLLALRLPRMAPARSADPASGTAAEAGVRAGVRLVRRTPALARLLAGGALLGFAANMPVGAYVLLVTDGWRAPTWGFGVAFAAIAAGGLLGAGAASRLPAPLRRLWVPAVLLAVGHAGIASASGLASALPFLALTGLAPAIWRVRSTALRQRLTPATLTGAVAGVARLLIAGAAPLGLVAGGVAIHLAGLDAALWASLLPVAAGAAVVARIATAPPTPPPADLVVEIALDGVVVDLAGADAAGAARQRA